MRTDLIIELESFTWTLAPGERWGIVTCAGSVFPGLNDVVFGDILDAAVEAEQRGILLDFRDCTGQIPDSMDRFEIGEQIAAVQLGKPVHVAVAFVGKEPIVSPERFVELVAVNRSADIRIVTDYDDAVAWLDSSLG